VLCLSAQVNGERAKFDLYIIEIWNHLQQQLCALRYVPGMNVFRIWLSVCPFISGVF